MRLSAEVLDANNVEQCRKLWGDGAFHSRFELDRIIATARSLLVEGRARGSLLRDNGLARYFGLTVFVDHATGAALMTDPHPRIGASLLADPGHSILDSEAIGRGNANDGLHMVVVSQGWDFSGVVGNPWPPLLGSILKEFEDVHAGYRLSAIMGEVFGDGGEVVLKSRAFPNTRQFTAAAGRGAALPSLVYWITRCEAEVGCSTLLPMFSYGVPRLLFTPQEQRMLRHALSGATDAELALQLGASLTAIKSQWRRVFDRAAVVDDTLVGADYFGAGTRGMQKRHVILDYVRRHPEELTAYDCRRRPREMKGRSRERSWASPGPTSRPGSQAIAARQDSCVPAVELGIRTRHDPRSR